MLQLKTTKGPEDEILCFNYNSGNAL